VKFERDGEALVSTPIYVGDDAAIAKAARCTHEFESKGEPQRGGPGGRALLQQQYCKLCVATRVRVTPTDGATIHQLLEGL